MKQQGFTLAEVLIALALLGIVVAFAIPKVLQTTADGERKAKFREVYSVLSEVTYKGVMDQALHYDNIVSYYMSKLNGAINCTNAQTQGCYPGAHTAPSLVPGTPGILLHNGVMIMDMENTALPTGKYDTFWVDLNGTKPPNTNCEDQIPLMVIYADQPITGYRAGTVRLLPTSLDAPNGCAQSVIDTLLK